MTVVLSFADLKARQRELREGFSENFGLRIHRALSWLNRAELETDDDDASFIFYWISFNAIYSEDRSDKEIIAERARFQEFFKNIVEIDNDNVIYDAIWEKFSSSIRVLLNNEFVFEPFWRNQNNVPGYEDWEEQFEKSKKRINHALSAKSTNVVLSTLFDRLYVLRNQLLHGGATWNGKVNRAQVKDGANIMAFLLPILIKLMMDNPDLNWGAPHYPVVDGGSIGL